MAGKLQAVSLVESSATDMLYITVVPGTICLLKTPVCLQDYWT